MIKVKTLLLAISLGLFATTAATAQVKEVKKDNTAVEEKQLKDELKPKGMEERLALTEEQKGPYKEINKKYAEKIKVLRENPEGDKIEKLKVAKSLQIDKDAEIKALLTEQQYTTYMDIRQERKVAKAAKKESMEATQQAK